MHGPAQLNQAQISSTMAGSQNYTACDDDWVGRATEPDACVGSALAMFILFYLFQKGTVIMTHATLGARENGDNSSSSRQQDEQQQQ